MTNPLYSRTMRWMTHQTCRVPTWKSCIFQRWPGILSARALETIGRLQKNSRDSTKSQSITEITTTRVWPMIWISCFWLHKVLQQSWFTRPVMVRFIKLTLASWDGLLIYKILGEDSQLAGGRYHLSQFPNLQHLEIRFRVQVEDNKNLFLFLNQLLSISSPTSLLETLIVDICWECQLEDILALFLPNIGWSALDETLTSNKFISLRQVSFYLDVYILTSGHSMEFEVLRRLARPDINALFPRLRNTVEVDIQSGIWLFHHHHIVSLASHIKM